MNNLQRVLIGYVSSCNLLDMFKRANYDIIKEGRNYLTAHFFVYPYTLKKIS